MKCTFDSFLFFLILLLSFTLNLYLSHNLRKQDVQPVKTNQPTVIWIFTDSSLQCPHKETLHPWLSKIHPVKIHRSAGWSESLHTCLKICFLMLSFSLADMKFSYDMNILNEKVGNFISLANANSYKTSNINVLISSLQTQVKLH